MKGCPPSRGRAPTQRARWNTYHRFAARVKANGLSTGWRSGGGVREAFRDGGGRRLARRETDYATIRLLASVVAFPLFWSLETSLVGWAADFRWALAFFLSLPLGGLMAYRYLVGTGRLRHQLRFGALLLTRAQAARRLIAERREIVEELERAWPDDLRGAPAAAM